MRFQSHKPSSEVKRHHGSVVSCVAWQSSEELYSCGDADRLLLRWSTADMSAAQVAQLPEQISCCTSMHCLPRASSSKNDAAILLVTCTDGKLVLLSTSGRLEKSVDAHKAAVLCSQISLDGSSIVTGAEDGSVKVWSRSAMLRSTVAHSSPAPVFACAWSPDSQSVTFAQGGSIVLKPLSPSLAATKWQAHDGLILSLAWSPANPGTLASGAEDCRYKVWDAEGRLLFSSTNLGSPVSAVAWSWDSKLLAVGSHNSLMLCNASGWSHGVERLNYGGINHLVWSKNNATVAASCGSGYIFTASVVDREVKAGSVELQLASQRLVRVRDLESSDQWEAVEAKSPVLHLVAGHGHVVLATRSQCLVYHLRSINTPVEIKVAAVFLLQITAKHVLAVNDSGYWVFTLEGRPVSLPRLPSLSSITEDTISLAPDTLAIRDHVDQRVVHVLELGSLRGAEVAGNPRVKHAELVRTLALNQTDMERVLAVVDVRGDLHVTPDPSATTAKSYKLGSMVRSILWNTTNPYLTALTESQLLVWFYPQIVAIDRNLLHSTIVERDLSELGGTTLVQFCGGLLELRRHDQVTVLAPVSPAPAVLYLHTERNQWERALLLLRQVSDALGMPPGCMHSLFAARCKLKNQAKKALVAYSTLGCVDAVEMLLADSH